MGSHSSVFDVEEQGGMEDDQGFGEENKGKLNECLSRAHSMTPTQTLHDLQPGNPSKISYQL